MAENKSSLHKPGGSAVVVGGGIIGLCSAYYLHKSGWQVMVLDKTDLTDSCSYGNLGMIVPSHFVPMATPGIVAQGIRWMFDNKSPFYVKPSLNWDLISWGLKFIKSATQPKVDKAAPFLRDINLLSKKLYEELTTEPGFDFAMEKKGILMYFKTEKTAEEETHLADKARSLGLDAVALNKQEVQALEPGIELDILGAAYYRCDGHLYPNKLIEQLLEYLKAGGVNIVTECAVNKVIKEGNVVKKLLTNKGEFEADTFIMAGGSWLPGLTKMAGITIPLMPGKGYSITYDQPEKKLNIPAILCEARVAITPMDGKMRYGGTMEIAPVNNKINMNRVQGIIESIPKYFSNIQLAMPEEKEVWYGLRPCSPDGLPYIGYAGNISNLLVAGGHAMMGLSLGPATGKIVSDLVNKTPAAIDISAFEPMRFS